jgi:hypothetical protein
MKFTTVFRATGDVGGAFLLCLGLGAVTGFGPLCGVPVVACVGLPLFAVSFALYALGVMTIGDWDAPPARQLAGAICNVVGLLVAFCAIVAALGYCFEELLRLGRANDLNWKTGLATASVSLYGYAVVVGLYTVGFGLRRRLRPVVAPMVAAIAGLVVPAPVFALVAMAILHKLPLSA